MSDQARIPRLRIRFDESGTPTVTLDGEDYLPPRGQRPENRADMASLLDTARNDLGSVRVEIVEADGSTFTDLIAAPSNPKDAQPTDEDGPTASGFLPGEPVAVAIIVAEHPATSDGLADVRLPSAILAGTCGTVVLLGRTSGTLALVGPDR
jgi:hypothetical protein